MKKELFIGGLATATAVVIGGAVLISSYGEDFSFLKQGREIEQGIIEENERKIEELAWEEQKDTKRYSFCFAEVKIESKINLYSPLGREPGEMQHKSKEILLFDKEAEKLFVLAHQSNYEYQGTRKYQMGDIFVDIPLSESGILNETYSKSENQIRIDFTNNYIYTSITPKNNLWVTESVGNETQMVPPRSGCNAVYELYQAYYSSGNSARNDMVINDDIMSMDRKCKGTEPMYEYDGSFSFSCEMIDHQKAKEMVEEMKIKEESQRVEEPKASKIQEENENYEENQRQTIEAMQKRMEELNDEMQGQKAPSGI